MKAQQINLYPTEFREVPTAFPAAVIVRLAGLFIVVLVVLTGGAALMGWSQRRAAQYLEGGLAERKARIEALEIEVSKHLDGSGLELRLGTVRAELESKRALARLLEENMGHSTGGFSPALVALGRQRVEGLWLTAFALTEGGETLALQGRTFSGARLLHYLQRLGDEASFGGAEFRTFSLERDEAGSTLLFDVRTDRGESGP